MGKYIYLYHIPSFKNAMRVGKSVRIIIFIFFEWIKIFKILDFKNGVSSAHQDFIYLIKNTVKYNIMSV